VTAPFQYIAAAPLVGLVEADGRVSVVSILSVDGEAADATESASEVVRHLRRHGLVADAHVLLEKGHTEAEAFEGFVVRHGTELRAIGAFSRSRLREVIFGGIDRPLIERPRLPLLLSRCTLP
jgi:nucleotide-binding universal stress UspA family protein